MSTANSGYDSYTETNTDITFSNLGTCSDSSGSTSATCTGTWDTSGNVDLDITFESAYKMQMYTAATGDWDTSTFEYSTGAAAFLKEEDMRRGLMADGTELSVSFERIDTSVSLVDGITYSDKESIYSLTESSDGYTVFATQQNYSYQFASDTSLYGSLTDGYTYIKFFKGATAFTWGTGAGQFSLKGPNGTGGTTNLSSSTDFKSDSDTFDMTIDADGKIYPKTGGGSEFAQGDSDNVTITAIDNDTSAEFEVLLHYGSGQDGIDSPGVNLVSDQVAFLYSGDTQSLLNMGQTINFSLSHSIAGGPAEVWTIYYTTSGTEYTYTAPTGSLTSFIDGQSADNITISGQTMSLSGNFANALNNDIWDSLRVQVEIDGTYTDSVSIGRLESGSSQYSVIHSNQLLTLLADEDGIPLGEAACDASTCLGTDTIYLYRGSSLRTAHLVENNTTAGTLTIVDNDTQSPDLELVLAQADVSGNTLVDVYDVEGMTAGEITAHVADTSPIASASFTILKPREGSTGLSFRLTAPTQTVVYMGNGTVSDGTITVSIQDSGFTIDEQTDVTWELVTSDGTSRELIDNTTGHNGTYLTQSGNTELTVRLENYFDTYTAETSVVLSAYPNTNTVGEPGGAAYTDSITFYKLIEGSAGEDAKSIIITSDTQSIIFDEGTLIEAAGDIVYTVSSSNLTDTTYVWTCSKADGTTCSTPSDGDSTYTITYADFALLETSSINMSVTTGDGLTDSITVV